MRFAGGIAADNVLEQIWKISAAVGHAATATWIDMEGRMRTDNGAMLDMSRVRRVLKQITTSGYLASTTLSTEPPSRGRLSTCQ